MIQRQFGTAFRPFPQPVGSAHRARIGMIGLGVSVALLALLNLAANLA